MSEVRFPDNALTQSIERLRTNNMREGSVSAEPSPSVRSAAMGPVPLAPEEKKELDAKARELGLMPPIEGEVQGPYATQAEAEAAGASIRPALIDKQSELIETQMRQTAREFIGSRSAPRLPDFTKVQMIDLVRGVVFVDSMEFPMSEPDVMDMRQYAVDLARDTIMEKLEQAANLFVKPVTPVEGDNGGNNTSIT